MGIGKIDNYKFYDGFEDEPEIEFSTTDGNMETLHIWDGYFYDIFGEPSLDGKGWNGFTRDFNQLEGAFGDTGKAIITDLQEYIDDLKIYENKKFDFEDTREVYELILSWLLEAQNNCKEIYVKVF